MVRLSTLEQFDGKEIVIFFKTRMIVSGTLFFPEAGGGFLHQNEAQIGLKDVKYEEDASSTHWPTSLIIDVNDISTYGVMAK